jgi:GNAT superfamily N-acetyltransferase
MPDSTTEPLRNIGAASNTSEEVVSLVGSGKLPLVISCAVLDDMPTVLELIDEAKLWLLSKATDQWSRDWADQQGRKRSDRVQDSLAQGTTWIVTATYEGQRYAVATVTIEPSGNPLVWDRPGDLDDSAVYLSRLVVARRFAGLKIGAALLNWACDYAQHRHQAELIRIDVWTGNFALHHHYRAQGFRWQGYCSDRSYPSRARFQRSTSKKLKRAPRLSAAVGAFS